MIRTILFSSVLLLSTLSAHGQEYFVSPTGSDANPGTLEKPMKSPVKAARNLKAGDTLFFRAGEYKCKTNGTYGLAPSADGKEGKPITFKNYKNEHVRIDCAGSDWGVTSNGYDWIVFDGLDIINKTHYGMKLSAASGRRKPGGGYEYSEHVTIRNCEIHHTRMENIFACETKYLTVENCYLHDSSRSHGIYLQVGCDNAVLRNITSVNNRGNSGTQLNGDGGDKGIRNALVERCFLSGNAQGYSLMNLKDSVFRNNVIYNNGYNGPRGSGWRETIMWTKHDKGEVGCANVLFENNTYVNLVPQDHKLNNLIRSKKRTRKITFRNNIFVVRGKPAMRLEAWDGFVFENNCVFNKGGGEHVHGGGKLPEFAKAKGLKEAGTIDKDPMFEDLATGNLRLKDGSPCLDTGIATKSETKTSGKGRDIGAYEKGAEVEIGCKLPWKKQ